ncbi:MAG: molybdopterin molybdotransferase MoeA [Sphingomonas sp.]|uniref:molybdopterin molybdotransferase MoeA n=1 Tax=Sphingomonas sp. TaxID=28214 RepID=UPI0012032253|nr:gephyrin-like molybdotransferase Glp [Sphingomonas sp.]THD35166.1 MAG: molybdopterin molybdotransferase MoeA [Sphingomonas sp.]
MDRASLLSVADARTRLFAMTRQVTTETVPLASAAGRWLANPVIARRSQPAADLSAMDGYAIRFADMPGPWRVVGESAAGRPFAGQVGAREAARIFTGAAMPAGADTVLVQEEAARKPAPAEAGGDALALAGEGPAHQGRNVRRKGLDFDAGDVLIEAGTRLTPARIALAATGGHGALTVNRRLRVAVLATGDELIAPGTPSADPLALPEGNSAMLAAMLADLPVDVTMLGIIPDRLDALTAAFANTQADIVVTTGGASVGDHDLVRPALEAAGGTIDFWRIALRPGKPMLAGTLREAVVLGLPGNPVSAFVTATLFLRPLVAAMAGARDPLPRTVTAILAEPLPANDHREDYLRGTSAGGRVAMAPIQDSSMLATLARADCLIARAPHAPPAEIGDPVEIVTLA